MYDVNATSLPLMFLFCTGLAGRDVVVGVCSPAMSAVGDLRVSAKMLLDEIGVAQRHLDTLRQGEAEWAMTTEQWVAEGVRLEELLSQIQRQAQLREAEVASKKQELERERLHHAALTQEVESASTTIAYLQAALSPAS